MRRKQPHIASQTVFAFFLAAACLCGYWKLNRKINAMTEQKATTKAFTHHRFFFRGTHAR